MGTYISTCLKGQKIIQVDILRALVGDVALHTTVIQQSKKRQMSPPIHVEDPKGSLLRSLHRVLHHAWQEDVTTMVLTKSDSSETPLHFWNKRISLLFPSFKPSILDLMWTALLKLQKQRLQKRIFLVYVRCLSKPGKTILHAVVL